MTNGEAIQILEPFRNAMVDQHGCPISDAVFALDVAIAKLKEPERKTGRWECVEYGNGLYNYHCTRCRNIPRGNVLSNFCPNCGADMRGEEDETN